MYHYAQAASASPSRAPWDALQAAYDGVEKDDSVRAGSATAVGVSLENNGRGRAVNLGDSGLTILRRGAAVFETVPQTHFFNCPYQLSKIPASMRSPELIMDTPDRAECLEFQLSPGDVVVLYTDGLSDNLPAAHIPLLSNAVLDMLGNEENASLSATERAAEHARLLADVLVAAGRHAMCRTGRETDWKTPFETESAKHGPPYRGGKVDDISVLTAVVSERLG
jgi:protein phosphatase PTC7